MKILNMLKNNVTIEFELQEVIIVRNAIVVTLEEIEEWELHPRMGLFLHEMQSLIKVLTNKIEDRNNENKIFILNLTNVDIAVARNSLNEVCYGLRLESFKERIGGEKFDVVEITKKINDIAKTMSPLV